MGLTHKETILRTVIGPPIEIKPDKLIGFPDYENMPVCGGVGTLKDIGKNLRKRNAQNIRYYSPRVVVLTETQDPKGPRYPVSRYECDRTSSSSDDRFTLEDCAEMILELEREFPHVPFNKIPEDFKQKKLFNIYYRRIASEMGIDNRIAA